MRERLERLTGGAAWLPLGILFGLNLVDEFDRIAFQTLLPEVRDAFGLSDTAIGAINVLALVFVALMSLPMGVIADRFNRVRVSAFAAMLWGTMAVATGIVPVVALLVVVRLLSGTGRVINEVVHPSLLGDFYRPETHPRIFQLHRLANPLSALLVGVVAGAIGELLGWQWAFFLLAIPTFLLIVALVRLREPNRGESIDADLAAEVAATQEPIPFGEALRQLSAVQTLRRLWVGSFLLGFGLLSIAAFLTLFFESVYDFGPFQRGVMTTVFGGGTIVGLFVGAQIAQRASEEGETPRLATITGMSFVVFAAGTALMAVAPWALLSAVFAFVLAAGFGAFQPAYYSLVGLVAPPRVRSMAYGVAITLVGAGAVLGIPLFALGDSQGYRTALVVLSVFIAVSGFVGASARRFVRRDIAQAQNTLEVAVRLREELASSSEQALLVCKDVEVAYDGVQVLFGVDFEAKRGEIVALLGTNGAGKSTILKAISGLVDPIGGAIFFDGRDITHADAVQTTKLGVIQVPGGKAVFPTLTVAEHLRSAGWLYRDDQAYLDRASEEVLETFPRLRERYQELAGSLSGGEQQMLALGMAFIAQPKLLMIDELSLGLAPTIVEQLLRIVRRIRDNGTTIVLVEQSVNVALTVSDRAYFLEKGEVRFEGPAQDLLERGDIVRSVFLEGAAKATGGDGEDRRERIRSVADPDDFTDREVVLSSRGLTKRFGGILAVDDVDLELRDGEILGLIGPNGAGKTTVFDLFSGYLVPDGGRITFDGNEVTDWSPDRRARAGLGRSFQDARLVPSLTVAENLAISLERHLEVRDHVAASMGLPGVMIQEQDIAWTVEDLIELMGLGAFRDKFVSELSTGSRRIVDLAMCIAHDPKVLLLDEPSSGIAQRETEALGPLLKRIQDETGCSMLVIEHDMPLITGLSDHIVALDLGRVLTFGTARDVIRHPEVVASYLGTDEAAIQRSGDVGDGARPAKRRKRKPQRKGTASKRTSSGSSGSRSRG